MDFIQTLLTNTILEHRDQYDAVIKLACLFQAQSPAKEQDLHKLSNAVVKMVGTHFYFLFDPLVQWVIAANGAIANGDFFFGLGEAVKKGRKKFSLHKRLEARRLEFVIQTQLAAMAGMTEGPTIKKKNGRTVFEVQEVPPRELRRMCIKEGLWKESQPVQSFRKWLTRNKSYISSKTRGSVDYFEETLPDGTTTTRAFFDPILGLSPQPLQKQIEFLRSTLKDALRQIEPYRKALTS